MRTNCFSFHLTLFIITQRTELRWAIAVCVCVSVAVLQSICLHSELIVVRPLVEFCEFCGKKKIG